MVNHSTHKESLHGDGQPFHPQRKTTRWWSTIPPTKNAYTVMVNHSTHKESLHGDGQPFHQ
jgi:hypothetical protein